MNDWKRLIAGCFVAFLCLLPTGRLYAGDKVKFKVNNADGFSITYEVKEGTKGLVSVTDAKVKKKAVLRIPETVEYEGQTYTVVEIADRAFGTNGSHGKPFSAVELPSTLRRIGKFAFQWCNRLERIELPEGLLIIDAYAFVYTYSLKQLSIPSSVIYIGSMAFQNWKPLNINYPKTCELGNLPAIVTPDNCEQYGLDTKSVARYYATNQAPVPIVDLNSEDIQRLIAAWNSASDAKWSKRMKIAQVAGVVGVAMGAAAVAATPQTNSGPTGSASMAQSRASITSGQTSMGSKVGNSSSTRGDTGGSGSTGGSSSNKTKKHHFCNLCSGSGKCSYCNGDGWYTALGTGKKADAQCPVCKNHNGKCNNCNGKGEWYD